MTRVTLVSWVKGIVGLVLVVGIPGCGGGGGGDDGDQPPSQDPSQNLAPANVDSQVLTLAGGSGREISFSSGGNIWSETTSEGVIGGTYEYNPAGNTAELRLGGEGRESLIWLTFRSENSGTYAVISPAAEQGNFTLQAVSDPGDPNDPGGNEGLAPVALDGRTLYGTRTFTSTGPVGQTHIYTFTGNTFHDSDPPEESDGAYIYSANGNRATLTLNYFAPREFDGDRHELSMIFHTEKTGSFESLYTRRDGTVIQINGTFQVQ